MELHEDKREIRNDCMRRWLLVERRTREFVCPFGVPSRFQTSTRFGSVEYCSILLIKFKQESEIEWIVEGILMYTSFIEDPENKATQMCNYLISSCIRALLRGRGRPKSNVNKQYTVADLLAK
jgi:hypothetical protein